jgi:hypothetical protein
MNLDDTYSNFQNFFEKFVEIHAPTKTKIIRGNSKPHLTKPLRKEIMKRSRLKNVANRTKLHADSQAYKKQRNLVVKLNKQHKQLYFDNISTKELTRSIWNLCKPFFGKTASK